jgi:hypothetical protein
MKLPCVIGTLLTALALASSVNLSAQDGVSNSWPYYLIPNGTTVYDAVNGVTWLTDADLAASVECGQPWTMQQPPSTSRPASAFRCATPTARMTAYGPMAP